MTSKYATAAFLASVITLATVSSDIQAVNRNPRVIPPNATYRGLTYGEWGAKWWQAAFSLPVVDGDHPFTTGGAFGGDDRVVFLAGVVDEPVELNITIPPGTALFFPIVNSECSVIEPDPFHGDDEAELRGCANEHLDNTSGLFAVIDEVPVRNLAAYRVQSPLFEFGPLPADNALQFFGVDAPGAPRSAKMKWMENPIAYTGRR